MHNKRILDGVLVVELASVLAGPSVGQFLAEVGAEVIKVENPNTNGDVTRSWKSEDENSNDISAYFSCANWGKKSLALDYSNPDGLEVLYSLIKKADIVITSYKSGDAKKLKTTYDHLRAINGKIIYASITGFGETDKRVGYDAVIQAESGFMSINGENGQLPLKLPVALMDILAGHQLKEAILLAYIKKLKEGIGSKVSVSLIDAAISSLANQATNWLVARKTPKQKGSLHPNIAPYGELFSTNDGKLMILAIGDNRQFNSLCKVLEISISDKFATNKLRVQNRKELKDELAEKISQRNSAELIYKLNELKVPVGLVRNIPDALSIYNKTQVSSDSISGIKNFVAEFDKSDKLSHFLPPPKYGEHSKEILLDKLGLNHKNADLLIEKGIIHQA